MKFLLCGLILIILLTSCEAKPSTQNFNSQNTVSDSSAEVNGNTLSDSNDNKPLGVQYNADGTTYLSKRGLNVYATPPTEGAAKAAWEYYALCNDQKYDEASKLLDGYGTDDKTLVYFNYTGEGRPYLEEVIGAKLIRWADITEVAPKEAEDEGAAAYKVIYLEMDFKTRGKLTPQQTDMKNGLNIYAIHVRQNEKGGPWKISMFGGAPKMEK
ncbi:hypothetical protein SAMN04487895_108137 [Paenibacillus sophorae]|uniref:DUF4829 domain-containing protein n=1 Tax=Paenibacillus sophorae TaxID=1333845 RepID=A0A1H8QBA1_9BACL|nr:hypothetical protein [Paenibacillus sophorae]QWU15209.1 hypothetical protein KP014_25525 [Paenibacillus sophorae]SEO51043.1 hypothetical protein SAMN04487895_108137 [Paenibacillus sophorae]